MLGAMSIAAAASETLLVDPRLSATPRLVEG
jgi:hypothetical protein